MGMEFEERVRSGGGECGCRRERGEVVSLG